MSVVLTPMRAANPLILLLDIQCKGMRYIPFSLSPCNSTAPINVSFTVKSDSVKANQQWLSLQNLFIESKLADANG